MQEFNILSKGEYTEAQSDNYVSLKRFLFIGEGEETYLLLQWENKKKTPVKRIKFTVVETDGEQEVDRYDVEWDVKGEELFGTDHRIKVHGPYKGFKVFVRSVEFEKTKVRMTGKKEKIEDLENKKTAPNKKRFGISKASFLFPALTAALGVILFIVLIVLSTLQINGYENGYYSFDYENLNYRILTDESTPTVVVTGYAGQKREIIIPGKIGEYTVKAIDNYAFYENKKVTGVVVQDNITLGAYAFANCPNLSYVHIDGVETIKNSCFEGCHSLSEVMLNDVSMIGSYAFSDCYSLDSVTLYSSKINLKLGRGVFHSDNIQNFSLLQKVDYNKCDLDCFSGIQRFGYFHISEMPKDSFGTITIPELLYDYWNTSFGTIEIDNLDAIPANFCGEYNIDKLVINRMGANVIPDYAFSYANLSSLELPKPVVSIGEYAFERSAIRSFDGSCATEIKQGAFYYCTELTSFTFFNNYYVGMEESLETIGSNAFSGCSMLEEIVIPQTVKSIEDNAFSDCTGLETVYLPGSLTYIGSRAFSNDTELKTISFPSTLKEIGSLAFSGCNGLREIVLPDGLKELGYAVFESCNGIRSMTLPFLGLTPNDANGTLSSLFISGSYYVRASYYPESLTEVTIKTGKNLHNNAFYECQSLQRVHLPSELESIGNYAFYGTAITSLDIPSGVTSFGQYAFGYCRKLTSVNTIPASVKTIGYRAFYSCNELESCIFPDTVETIGEGVLTYCGQLKDITLPFIGKTRTEQYGLNYLFNTNGYYNGSNNVPSSLHSVTLTEGTEIPDYAFYNCKQIKTIDLPSGITKIGKYAYYGMTFSSIEIDPAVTSIGEYAFAYCENLLSIDIPASVKTIKNYAFCNCSKFTSFVVPDTVESIGEGILINCNRLKILTLPFIGSSRTGLSSLSYIFGGSYNSSNVPSSLSTVTLTQGTELPSYAFYNCKNINTISLPAGITKIGNYAYYGTKFSSFDIPSSVTYIGESAFANCEQLISVTIPNSVKTLGYNAFNNCSMLASLVVPDSVEYIGSNVLRNCRSLSELTVPFLGQSRSNLYRLNYLFGGTSSGDYDRVPSLLTTVTVTQGTALPAYAFYGCSYLRTINLPSTLQSIGDYAFALTNLRELTIPSSVTQIYSNAFYGCRKLYEICNDGQMSLTPGSDLIPNTVSVYSSAAPAPKVTIGGFTFLRSATNGWYLIKATPVANLELPKSFVYDATEIKEYGIANYLFYNENTNDVRIQQLSIPADCVVEIGECAFREVPIDNIVFTGQGKLTKIANDVFNTPGCEEIAFPEGLVEIGARNFYDCSSLRMVTLPSTLTTIGYNAFYDCDNLLEVANYSNIELTPGSDGNGSVARCVLFIYTTPMGKRAKKDTIDGVTYFHTDDKWYVIDATASTVVLDEFEFENVRATNIIIKDYALYGNDNIRELKIGAAVKEIGEYAFSYCSNLSKVDLSESVLETIPTGMMSTCSKLSILYLPNDLKTISSDAFSYCYQLKAVDIPDSVVNIGNRAFYYCYALSVVRVGVGLTFIASGAFYNCTSLDTLYNYSAIAMSPGETTNGYIAYYAEEIITEIDRKDDVIISDESLQK